jgi:hypothetical protein
MIFAPHSTVSYGLLSSIVSPLLGKEIEESRGLGHTFSSSFWVCVESPIEE